jgi:hypothetical protein
MPERRTEKAKDAAKRPKSVTPNSPKHDAEYDLAQRALAQPTALTPNTLLALQRVYGNQAVQRLFAPQRTPADTIQRRVDQDVLVAGVKFDRSIIPATIHKGQQDKHIKTSSNYKNAVKSTGTHKSAMTADPTDLLTRFHAGEFTVLAYDGTRKSAVVDFETDVGEVIEETSGTVLNTTRYGSVRHGGGGVHIIPINYTP